MRGVASHPLAWFVAGTVVIALWQRATGSGSDDASPRPSPASPPVVEEGSGWDDALVERARRLGLDRHDPVVRRRLVQVMEAAAERDIDPATIPADEVAAWLRANPERVAGVRQLDVSVRTFAGPGQAAAAEQALARLAREPDAPVGDAFVHGQQLRGADAHRLRAVLGPDVAGALLAADGAAGRWLGPFAGTQGTFVLRIDRSLVSGVPTAAEAEALARSELAAARSDEARREVLRRWVDEARRGHP